MNAKVIEMPSQPKEDTDDPLFLIASDADYILHPVAEAMLAAGVPKMRARALLRIAARRSMRMALMNVDMTVNARVIDNRARRIAGKLLAAA